MDAKQALADLTEISSQIDAAVIVAGDGAVAASTLPEDRARQVADKARQLLAAADALPSDGGQPVVQLEAATSFGSFFVVREGDAFVAATTGRDPTVGLVFYDLKSCLRRLDEAGA